MFKKPFSLFALVTLLTLCSAPAWAQNLGNSIARLAVVAESTSNS